MDQLVRRVFDVVICDVRLPKIDGQTLFRRIRKETPSTEVILMTAYADVSQAVSALKEGAYDYLTKPFDIDELLVQMRRIDENRALRRELERARHELSGRKPATALIGESPAIRRVVEVSHMVAQSEAPVLITGDSGTGKEVVARMIHEHSARRDKPFVPVNCGALAENLIEAELFGHERGAFTGAVKKRDGRFKAADGGVLFLDEIAELPAPAQAKLLRVLQEGTFEPLGTNSPLRVDVRIISATHRNLAGPHQGRALSRGPVLSRERHRDSAPSAARAPGRPSSAPASLHPEVHPSGRARAQRLAGRLGDPVAVRFPGNVRELSHAIEHAMVLSGGKEIDLPHLPPGMLDHASSAAAAALPEATGNGSTVRPLHLALREFEHQYLRRALKAADGKRNRTAAMLGISRKTLWEKLRNNGLEPHADPGEPSDAEEMRLPPEKHHLS